jgi:hypothetical protein
MSFCSRRREHRKIERPSRKNCGRELPFLMRGIMEFMPWVIAAYLAICAATYFGNRMFMYFPDQARILPAEAGLDGVEEIEFTAADSTKLVAWYAPSRDGKPTILYFHGNAGQRRQSRTQDINDARERLRRFLPQ